MIEPARPSTAAAAAVPKKTHVSNIITVLHSALLYPPMVFANTPKFFFVQKKKGEKRGLFPRKKKIFFGKIFF